MKLVKLRLRSTLIYTAIYMFSLHFIYMEIHVYSILAKKEQKEENVCFLLTGLLYYFSYTSSTLSETEAAVLSIFIVHQGTSSS